MGVNPFIVRRIEQAMYGIEGGLVNYIIAEPCYCIISIQCSYFGGRNVAKGKCWNRLCRRSDYKNCVGCCFWIEISSFFDVAYYP